MKPPPAGIRAADPAPRPRPPVCRRIILALSIVAAAAQALEPAQVLVLANRRLTNSVALATTYLQSRGIPPANLVVLDLPESEVIARGLYETQLRDPLLAVLRERGLAKQVRKNADGGAAAANWSTVDSPLRALVCMRGVPLRIAPLHPFLEKASAILENPLRTDGAAVDSELALLLADPYALKGRIPNPAYQALRWKELGDRAFTVLMATRLDAADDATVRRMIEDARAAETNGLQGRAYFDLRSSREDGYELGDYWLGEAAERFQRQGYECVIDRHDGIFGVAYPMDQAMFYLGWYTEQAAGPFLQPDFHFQPGAIAYHLHSSSARSLRSATNFWAAPLLHAGACATMGATAEPLLGLTPNMSVFADRLLRGRCFGESAYLAMPALSWQITVIGDPLYKPFGASGDAASPLAGAVPRDEWEVIRLANLLVRDGRYNGALDLLRQRLRTTPSPVLQEKLGDLYARGDLPEQAAALLVAATEAAPSAPFAVRSVTKAMAVYRAMGQPLKAAEIERKVRERWAGHPCLGALETVSP